MNSNQDLFSSLGESQGDFGDSALGGDPFNDSNKDFFDKFLREDFDRSNSNVGLPEGQLLMSANEHQFQDMLGVDKGVESMHARGDGGTQNNCNLFSFAGQTSLPSNQGMSEIARNSNNSWFNSAVSSNQPLPMTTMLDATPLDISLGDGECIDIVSSNSNGNVPSMLRRKGSNAQIQGPKMGLVRKVGLTSSKLRSAKSEGMLARALKAKYNSGNSLNMYTINAAEASAVVNSRIPNSSSASGSGSVGGLTQRLSQSDLFGDDNEDLLAVERQPDIGGRNASWSSWAGQRPGASMFADLLQHPGVDMQQQMQPVTSSSSVASLLRQQVASSGGSRTSMQDLLRLSKKQSKTQTALRQSSAQSLLKQTSSQLLKGPNEKVDVSNLLPPHHAMMGLSISGHTPSPKLGTVLRRAVQSSQFQTNNMDGASLLHQSCRLYPRTAAVVESALRMDPMGIRKAVPVASEEGQVRKGYGYPVNLAITHGGSLEVIKLLIQAGPDVLVQKDGTDGSGSLSIALSNNVGLQVIEMLLQANPECVQVADRKGNYPLHVAVSNGLAFQLVKRLHAMYPMALQMRNFHSQTPLDIAQRSTRCSEEVMNFLQINAFSRREVHHLDRHNRADLEDGLDDIMETNF
jgi:Ankyrin repeats (many copies)